MERLLGVGHPAERALRGVGRYTRDKTLEPPHGKPWSRRRTSPPSRRASTIRAGPSTDRTSPGSTSARAFYRCDCRLPVRSSSGLCAGLNRYTRREACFYRSGRPVDEYVIRGRLAQADQEDLLVKQQMRQP